jgi:hypothetical protein
MTVVVEGKMEIQFFTKDCNGDLIADGSPVTLTSGQTGYVAAGALDLKIPSAAPACLQSDYID